jgi:hypothetical protein
MTQMIMIHADIRHLKARPSAFGLPKSYSIIKNQRHQRSMLGAIEQLHETDQLQDF